MNIKSIKKTSEMNKAKGFFFGFVFILVFSFFFLNSMKVKAVVNVQPGVGIEILNTQFDKNQNDVLDSIDETFTAKNLVITGGSDKLTFVEGNGGQIGVTFRLTGFPSNAKAFVIMENDYSDSSPNADMDKYK